MLANAANLRRAGLLLRAMCGSAGWTAGMFVDARQVAKDGAIAATDKELADAESYMADQGWLATDGAKERGVGWYAITKHGLDEAQRKQPAEPKPYTRPTDNAD
jgi:hypothetical protein